MRRGIEMSKERVFTVKDSDGKDRVLRLNVPSQKVLAQGDFIYRQYFSSAIRAGILTNAEANKLLSDREIWGDDNEDVARDLRVKIKDLEDMLGEDSNITEKKGKNVCQQLKKLREELNRTTRVYTSVTDNTAESLAHEARLRYYASECVVDDETGDKIFSDLDDYENRMNEQAALAAYREAMIANFERILGVDMPNDLGAQYPEDKWLAELEKAKEEKPKPARRKKRKNTQAQTK